MKISREVIKIVSIENGDYVSLVGSRILGYLTRTYTVGKKTYPKKGTFLYAYDKYVVEPEVVSENLELNQAVLLCEADVVPSIWLDVPCLDLRELTKTVNVVYMWENYQRGVPFYYSCPRGAVACRWIRPIKVIRELREAK